MNVVDLPRQEPRKLEPSMSATKSGKSPEADVSDFDVTRLFDFLRARIAGLEGTGEIVPIAGGQSNPTYEIRFANRKLVLRKRPPGELLPSAHAVDREYRVQKALRGQNVPVPEVILLHEDTDLIGTAFYVMDFLDGRVFSDVLLPGLPPEDRRDMYRSAAEALARLHRLEPARIGLENFGRPTNYFQRQIRRWHRQWGMGCPENEDFEYVKAWLEDNIPNETQRPSVVHGDYRIGNLMYHPTQPRVVGVLDWELATIGDGSADLAHFASFTWHMTPGEYGGVMGQDLVGSGIPTQAEFFDFYHAANPDAGVITRFHIAFAVFRNAAIFEGIAARARAGNASSDNAAKVGRLGQTLARRARDLLG